MRFAGLGAVMALGTMLAMPAFAQTTPAMPAAPAMPSMPAVKPPVVSAPAMPSMPAAAKPAVAAAKPAMGPVDLNSASAADLDKVKYIGPKRAAKIIAGRPWKSPDDLVTQKILPQKTYDKIKDRFVAK